MTLYDQVAWALAIAAWLYAIDSGGVGRLWDRVGFGNGIFPF